MSTKKQKRERLQKAWEETAKKEFKYTTSHRSGRIQLCAYRQGNGIVRELAVTANLRPFLV